MPDSKIAELWARKIQQGERTIKDVPEKFVKKVKELLKK